jgi:hypothetical protein
MTSRQFIALAIASLLIASLSYAGVVFLNVSPIVLFLVPIAVSGIIGGLSAHHRMTTRGLLKLADPDWLVVQSVVR